MFYGTVVQYDTRIVVIRIVYLSIFKVRFWTMTHTVVKPNLYVRIFCGTIVKYDTHTAVIRVLYVRMF